MAQMDFTQLMELVSELDASRAVVKSLHEEFLRGFGSLRDSDDVPVTFDITANGTITADSIFGTASCEYLLVLSSSKALMQYRFISEVNGRREEVLRLYLNEDGEFMDEAEAEVVAHYNNSNIRRKLAAGILVGFLNSGLYDRSPMLR